LFIIDNVILAPEQLNNEDNLEDTDMSLCPLCGRNNCQHSPEEKGQTLQEVLRPLTKEEEKFWMDRSEGDPETIMMARRNAHLDPSDVSPLRLLEFGSNGLGPMTDQ
jgi:hypothetical protein